MSDLTSQQRMEYFYAGKQIDRVPMLSSATMYAGLQKGLTSAEFYFDMKKTFHAQKQVCEEGGYDDLPCYDLPHGEMLDLGGEITVADSQKVEFPKIKTHAITTEETAWNYKLLPIEKRLFTKRKMEFHHYAKTQGQLAVSISAGSPFTMVGSMMETGTLMEWLVVEPEIVKHLLSLAIQYLSETADLFIEEFGLENCSVSSNYPFESNLLISPRHFEQFAYPAMMEIHEILRKKGLKSFGLHLCGNHLQNLEFFKDLALQDRSFISSDEENPLTEVAKVLGENMIYAGNVSSKLLVYGKPGQVYKQAGDIVREMKYNAGGFVLMPSCDLPINTKPENLKAMLQAACDVGRY